MTELKTIPHPPPLRCPECSSDHIWVEVTRRYPSPENPTHTVRWLYCEECKRATLKTVERHDDEKTD